MCWSNRAGLQGDQIKKIFMSKLGGLTHACPPVAVRTINIMPLLKVTRGNPEPSKTAPPSSMATQTNSSATSRNRDAATGTYLSLSTYSPNGPKPTLGGCDDCKGYLLQVGVWLGVPRYYLLCYFVCLNNLHRRKARKKPGQHPQDNGQINAHKMIPTKAPQKVRALFTHRSTVYVSAAFTLAHMIFGREFHLPFLHCYYYYYYHHHLLLLPFFHKNCPLSELCDEEYLGVCDFGGGQPSSYKTSLIILQS